MPGGNNHRPLKNLTAKALRPLWSRLDIPTERIAKALGVTRSAVSYKARTLGLPPRTGNQECNKLLPDEVFKRMWLAGVSSTDMAKLGGYRHRSAISHRRTLLGLPPRTRGKGGKNHSGWKETITLLQFQEMEMARLMKERDAA
jgi:hypothetical protein